MFNVLIDSFTGLYIIKNNVSHITTDRLLEVFNKLGPILLCDDQSQRKIHYPCTVTKSDLFKQMIRLGYKRTHN